MKRIVLLAILAVLSLCQVKAQEQDVNATNQRIDSLQAALEVLQQKENDRSLMDRYNKIWKNKYFRVGYAIAQTSDGINPVEKSDFGVFLNWGKTFRFPKKPLWGMVKLGIDLYWIDLQFSKYKDPNSNDKWTSDINTDNSGYDDGDADFDFKLDRMALSYGVGVGPNISVAPFINMSKGLQPLLFSVYYHYSPSVQLFMYSGNDETELSTAFCNMMDFGGNITYRRLTLGIEGRWGNGKFKPVDFGDVIGEGESLGTDKYTRKFANTRIYLQLSF